MPTRRQLLMGAAGLLATAASTRAAAAAKIERSILISMLPSEMPRREAFQMAVDLGYTAMEVRTVDSRAEAEAIHHAAEAAGLRIHSVMNQAHWQYPLSSPDPEEVDRSVEGMLASLEQAQLYGAGVVLLVPAVVRDDTTYEQAWERSQQVIRQRILPAAEERDIVVGIEEVWNKFLLTAADFCRYIDQFEHPLVKAYFDIGNIVHYGVPQHWIRQAGDRIVRLHLKDYSRAKGFVNLGEGDVDWPAVRAALDAIGFEGEATVELPAGDRAYLADLGERVDRLLNL